jgi:type VI protein secretion system component Hcp
MPDSEMKITLKIPDLDRHLRPNENLPRSFSIQNISFGMGHDQSGATTSKRLHMYELNCSRETDAATAVFMRMCATREVINSVHIEIVQTLDGKEISRVDYELVGATIGAVHTGYSAGSGHYHTSENVVLNYDKIKVHAKQGEYNSNAELVPPNP